MNDTIPACGDTRLLIQADLDGELDAAAAAALATHLRNCPGCAGLQRELMELSTQLRDQVRPEAAPERLRRALQARLLPAAPPPPPGSGDGCRPVCPSRSAQPSQHHCCCWCCRAGRAIWRCNWYRAISGPCSRVI